MSASPMHRLHLRMWGVFALLAAVLIVPRAAMPKSPTDAPLPDPAFSNESLERSRNLLDAKLANRVSNIEKNTASLANFQSQIKHDRIEFERHQTEEERAFLLYMKSMSPDEREPALKLFTEKQTKKRTDFDKSMLTKQQDWFQENIKNTWQSASIDTEPSGKEPSSISMDAPAEGMKEAKDTLAPKEPKESLEPMAASSQPQKPAKSKTKGKKSKKVVREQL